jgi:hypothetical protein
MALRRPAAALFVITAFVLPAYSQTKSATGTGSVSFSVGLSGTGIKGFPYSAEFVTETVQTLADGTRITSQQKQVQTRDSQGRTRQEVYFPDSVGADQQPAQPVFVMIMDPIGGRFIHLNMRQKTANVNEFGIHAEPSPVPRKEPPAQTAIHRGSTGHDVSNEKLGGETIDGLYAEGTRTTEVIRAGSEGNDRDFTVVTEDWFSPELKIEVLNKRTDPRTGVTTTKVENLNRDEPDPALFEVPPDYKVQTPPAP